MTCTKRLRNCACIAGLAVAIVGRAALPALGFGGDSNGGSEHAESLLSCNEEAIGRDALGSVQSLTYRLEIEEPTFNARAVYRARRSGAVRVDIFMQGARVMSEGWDEHGGWRLPQGADAPTQASAEGEENLRHGFELPGHLWTLADVRRRGHRVTHVGKEHRDGTSYHVFEVELADGHRAWYLLDPKTCLVERSRDFRSFHPDMGTEASWVETVYEDFREVSGVVKPHMRRNIDYVTGDTLSETVVTELEVNRHDESEAPLRPRPQAASEDVIEGPPKP